MKETQLQQIDNELERWRDKCQHFTEQRARAEVQRSEAQRERETLLLAARGEGDKTAQRKLEAATKTAIEAEVEVRDLGVLIEQIDGKLRALDAERAVAARDAARAQVRDHATNYLQLLPDLEQSIEALISACTRLQASAQAMDRDKATAQLSLLSLVSYATNPRDFVKVYLQWRLSGVLPGLLRGPEVSWVREMFGKQSMQDVMRVVLAPALADGTGSETHEHAAQQTARQEGEEVAA